MTVANLAAFSLLINNKKILKHHHSWSQPSLITAAVKCDEQRNFRKGKVLLFLLTRARCSFRFLLLTLTVVSVLNSISSNV